MNKVVLKGRLGNDPTLSHVGSKNTAKAVFSMAVPDKLDPKNADKIYWANLVVWGQMAENASKYLSKGSEVLFIGRLVRSTWTKDGVKHTRDEVVVEEMEFCGPPPSRQQPASNPMDDPDIPF